MKSYFLCKRYYTNKDLLRDRFGRLYHLPVQLARHGVDVTVMAIDYRNASVEEASVDGVTFVTVPATVTRVWRSLASVYASVRRAQPQILIASGDSHIGALGRWLSRRARSLFVFDVYDHYPAFLGNRLPGMKAMFDYTVENADLVLCASGSIEAALVTMNRRTLLVENGVDPSLFRPRDMREARSITGLPMQASLVGYFGSITRSRGPILIEACRRLRESMPALRLVLAGRATDVALDEPWIIYLGELPQESIATLISACDVVTVPYADDAFNSMSGACKIAEYLACKKPVVATRVSSHERIFGNVANALCEPDAESMAAMIRAQLEAPNVAPFPSAMDWEHIGSQLHASLVDLQERKIQ